MNDVNVIDIGERLKTDQKVRAMVSIIKAGPGIADALETVMPSLPQYEQRILGTVYAFRLMGAMMPASIELFAHTPLTASIQESHLTAAVQSLVDGGVLVLEQQGDEACFMWPALERLVAQAILEQDAPKIVGIDGERIR